MPFSVRAMIIVALCLLPGCRSHGATVQKPIVLSIGSSDQPAIWINWFKNAGSQILNGNSLSVLDANGYPNNRAVTAGIGITNIIGTLPTLAQYGGTWETGWSGTGAIQFQFTGITIVSDPGRCYDGRTYIISGTNCDVVFNFHSNPIGNVIFPSRKIYSNMHSAFLIRSSDRAAYLAGLPCTPEWINILKPLHPLALRTMGMVFPNQSNTNSASWAYRTPVGSFSYQNGTWFPNLWSSSITGTDQYDAAAAIDTPAQWTDGEMLQGIFANSSAAVLRITGAASDAGLVQFTVSSTASLSTNQRVLVSNAVNNGAAPKVYTITVVDGTHLDLQGTRFSAGVWTGGGQITTTTINIGGRGAKFVVPLGILGDPNIVGKAPGTVVYDGLLDVVLYVQGPVSGGVPFETLIAMANQVQVPMWWNIPPLYSRASVTSAIQYASANLDKDLYVEFANENWNFGSGGTAPGAQWYLQRGLALALGGIGRNQAIYSYAGLRSRQLMEAVGSAWRRPPSTLHRVLAAQAFGNASQFNQYQFSGQLLCGSSCGNATYQNSPFAGVDYNSEPNRPKDFAEGYSVATYFQGCQAGGSSGTLAQLGEIINAATQYAEGNTLPALNFMDSDTRAGTWTGGASCNFATLAGLTTNVYAKWSAVVFADNKSFYAYEGAYSGTAPSASYLTSIGDSNASADATNIFNLILAYRNSPPFKQVVIDWNNQLFANMPGAAGNSWLTVQGPGTWSLLMGSILTPNNQYQSYFGVQTVNFLLKRDLDGVANDNTPAFLNQAT